VKIQIFTVSADLTIGDTKSIVYDVVYPSRTSLPFDHIILMNEKNHIYTDAYTLATLYKEHKVGRCSLTV
jgi:hypothetical protein